MKIKVEVVGIHGGGGKPALCVRPKDKPQAWIPVEEIEGEAKKQLYPGAPYWTDIEIKDDLAKARGWL